MLFITGTEPTTQEGVPPGYVSVSLVDALNGPSKDHPGSGANVGMIINSDDVTVKSNKKSRKNRRGSKEGSSSKSGQGPRQSSSTSSQLSQVSTSLTEEPPTSVENSNLNSNLCSEESPTATAISTHLQQQTSKVKSAETNVKVSLQIVNEVENTNVTRKSNESLDIVEEELAKMAVAGMH